MKQFISCVLCSLLTFSITSLMAQKVSYYISDAGNFNLPPWQILKFDENGENGEVFISDHLDWPQDILFFENSNTVLISNLNSGSISRFNATTGAYIDEFATGIEGPTRMKIGKDSLLYVLQWDGIGKILRFTLDGTPLGPIAPTGVMTAIGLDWDSEGNLYVSSYSGKRVRKFSSSGTDLGNFIGTGLAGPTNIWFEANGDLLVNDYNAGLVKRYGSDGVFKENFISNVPQCEGVQVLSNGNILLGVGGTSSVRIFNANGNFIKNLVDPGTLNLLTPNAVVRRELMSTAIDPVVNQDIQFTTPTIGTVFHFQKNNATLSNGTVRITNSAGAVVGNINLAETDTWNATSLPDGIYLLTLEMVDITQARQMIVVQH